VFATSPETSPAQVRRALENPDALRDRIRRVLADREPRSVAPAVDSRRAAVLVPMIFAAAGPALVLTQRTDTVEHHKGQISFPGGRVERDEAPLAAALRETSEEIGVSPPDVRVLGRLDEEDVRVSGFIVTPFVCEIPYPARLRLSAHEVQAVILAPLAVLLDPANVRAEVREWKGAPGVLYFYQVGREVIWGATGRIIAGFLDVVFGVPPARPERAGV
jgi:8-oxo-dGTP pyrophosphatase MutT (NUDIX family)